MAADPATGSPEPSRSDRRRLRTRAALVRAAQQLIAEGRPNVAVAEITQLADVGLGSFYNHFDSKEQLYRAALDDVLDTLGAVLADLTGGLDDAAEAFAQSFRLTGRLFRLQPRLSRVLLSNGVELIGSDTGLAPRARRDIGAAIAQGRFRVADVDVAVAQAAGTLIALGALLESRPDRDDARTTDAMTEDLLRVFGVPADEAADICRRPLPDLTAAPVPERAPTA